jgi:hypothetical protein
LSKASANAASHNCAGTKVEVRKKRELIWQVLLESICKEENSHSSVEANSRVWRQIAYCPLIVLWLCKSIQGHHNTCSGKCGQLVSDLISHKIGAFRTVNPEYWSKNLNRLRSLSLYREVTGSNQLLPRISSPYTSRHYKIEH